MAIKRKIRKNKVKKPDFVLEIEDNALTSLKHGIEHFVTYEGNPIDLKFALIHVFHSVELFLKARLAKEHPLLIYSRPECSISDDAHTVGFDDLIGRLRNAGIVLPKDDIESLDFLRKFRNSIEHHKIKSSKEVVKNFIGRAARFIEFFLEDQLEIILKEEVDRKTYRTLAEAIYTYEERLKKTREEIDNYLPMDGKDRLEYYIEWCPDCGEETVPIPDPTSDDEFARCFFCDEKFYFMRCRRCGGHILSHTKLEGTDNDPGMCDRCWEDVMSKD